MAGGIAQIIHYGPEDYAFTGNPTKSFFKSGFVKHTNFALQKFRLDADNNTSRLRMSEESKITFTVKRYANLLVDAYIIVDLPNIWSPIMPPTEQTGNKWSPYEFRWIENIGAQMIKNIKIYSGGQTFQEFSGDSLLAIVQGEFTTEKKNLFNRMIGNVAELTDPKKSKYHKNSYPNAKHTDNPAGPEPSIKARQLCIPLNPWFMMKTQNAFPLVSMQMAELMIDVTFRPVNEIFQIRNVYDFKNNYPYVAPNFSKSEQQFKRFIHPPKDVFLDELSYSDMPSEWNANIHLRCTYAFLDKEEERVFAECNQTYMIRQIRESRFYNLVGTKSVELPSLAYVTSYRFYFQRSDVNLRNEWGNHTNLEYRDTLPNGLVDSEENGDYPIQIDNIVTYIGSGINPDGTETHLKHTGLYNPQNNPAILKTMAYMVNSEYREDEQPEYVYNYLEKYLKTAGDAPDQLYIYNFCLNSSPFNLNSSGGFNTACFNEVGFEMKLHVPPQDPNAQTLTICDPQTNQVVGINKSNFNLYKYTYNLVVFEERLNFIEFRGGSAGIRWAN